MDTEWSAHAYTTEPHETVEEQNLQRKTSAAADVYKDSNEERFVRLFLVSILSFFFHHFSTIGNYSLNIFKENKSRKNGAEAKTKSFFLDKRPTQQSIHPSMNPLSFLLRTSGKAS